MINNYLDFVKGQRKRALQRARKAMQDERIDCSEICQGIDAGLRIAFDCQSRHWRTLQKDIEGRQAEGYSIISTAYGIKQPDYILS